MTLTNYPIDNALAETEKTLNIDLVNKITGATFAQMLVHPDNTFAQIVSEYGSEIGISNSKLIFTNKRTGESTSSSSDTVASLNFTEGDVLAISDDGNVAGDDTINIDLVNKITGTTFTQVTVYPDNTFEQVALTYGAEIGISTNEKLIFTNKRTGESTSSSSDTVASLNFTEGDVLAISDDGNVAGGDTICITARKKNSH